MHSSSPARTPKLQLTTEQPLTRECWILPEKDTPHTGAKEKSQQDTGWAKCLESNPMPSRDVQKAQQNLRHPRIQASQKRLRQTCL